MSDLHDTCIFQFNLTSSFENVRSTLRVELLQENDTFLSNT